MNQSIGFPDIETDVHSHFAELVSNRDLSFEKNNRSIRLTPSFQTITDQHTCIEFSIEDHNFLAIFNQGLIESMPIWENPLETLSCLPESLQEATVSVALGPLLNRDSSTHLQITWGHVTELSSHNIIDTIHLAWIESETLCGCLTIATEHPDGLAFLNSILESLPTIARPNIPQSHCLEVHLASQLWDQEGPSALQEGDVLLLESDSMFTSPLLKLNEKTLSTAQYDENFVLGPQVEPKVLPNMFSIYQEAKPITWQQALFLRPGLHIAGYQASRNNCRLVSNGDTLAWGSLVELGPNIGYKIDRLATERC